MQAVISPGQARRIPFKIDNPQARGVALPCLQRRCSHRCLDVLGLASHVLVHPLARWHSYVGQLHWQVTGRVLQLSVCCMHRSM